MVVMTREDKLLLDIRYALPHLAIRGDDKKLKEVIYKAMKAEYQRCGYGRIVGIWYIEQVFAPAASRFDMPVGFVN